MRFRDGDGDGDGDLNNNALGFSYREVDPPTTTEFVEPIALSNDGHVLISGHGEPQISGTAVPFVWRGPGDIEEIEIPDDYAYFWQEQTKPGCLWTGDRVVLTVRRLDTAKRRPLVIDGTSVTEILVADDATELLLTHCSDRGSYVIGRSDDFGDAWRWHAGQTTFLYQDGLVGSPLGVNRHGEVCAPPAAIRTGARALARPLFGTGGRTAWMLVPND